MAKKGTSNGIYIRNGKYYIRVELSGRDIRKCIGQVSSANRAAAQALIRDLKTQAAVHRASGTPYKILDELDAANNRMTFAELTEEFLREKADSKPSSIEQYTSCISCHLMPAFGKMQLRDITEAMVAEFQAKLSTTMSSKGKMRSASRVNTIVQQLRTLMALAKRRKYISEDPTTNVKRKQEPAVNIDPLSDDELALALDNIDQHYKPLFTCLAFTGARPNELEALRWNDIDWRREEINISKGRVKGNESLPKSKSAHRIIPLTKPVLDALEELKARPLQHADGFVFIDKKGQPIKRHLDRIWERALKKAGIRHRPSYQLRHTFASQCLLRGLPPGYVAKLLGHSGLEMLYRHYARWIEDASKQQEILFRQSFNVSSAPAENSLPQKEQVKVKSRH